MFDIGSLYRYFLFKNKLFFLGQLTQYKEKSEKLKEVLLGKRNFLIENKLF